MSYEISSSRFLPGPTTKRFAINLTEQELNQLVEQRHSAFGDGPNKTTNWSVSTFRENYLNVFGEHNLYMRVFTNFCFK